MGGPLAPVGRWWGRVHPRRAALRADVLAGLPGAIASVPNAMASAVLAGVNPLHGLYASITGPIAGGLSTSTSLMVVTTTSASALAAGSALEVVPADDRAEALVLLAALAGIVMVVAGIARLGRYTRFVSYSVMVGFLSGIAVNIVLSQLGDLVGAEASRGSIPLTRAIDVLLHPGRWNPPSLACGLVALAVMAGLGRTRLSPVAAVVALAVPTLVASVVGAASVREVDDVGALPTGLPLPGLPRLDLIDLSVVGGAFAVAAIVLVQGAGVAEAAPNPDGREAEPDVDFVGQGVGNLAAGAFGGMPVGGSLGQTALNRAVGARTRWGAIWAGVWMGVVVLLFAPVVAAVVVPALAAVLIYAAATAIHPREMEVVLRTSTVSRIAIASTFAATLLLPVAAAVGLGVVVSLLLQVDREALDLRVVELTFTDDGAIRESDAPERLAAHRVTVLDVYGSLFYAGARTLAAQLPDAVDVDEAVVVLRLRGRTELGSTSFLVLAGYADRLARGGGRLYLSGVDPHVLRQFARSRRRTVHGPVELYEATPTLGESSRRALADAETWLLHHHDPGDAPD